MIKSLKNNWPELLLHILFWGYILNYFTSNSLVRPFAGFNKEVLSLINLVVFVYFNFFILFKYFNKKGTRGLYWIFTFISIILSGFVEHRLVLPEIMSCMGDLGAKVSYFHLVPIITRNAGFMLVFIIIRYYKESVMYSKKLIRMFEIERLYLSSRIAPHYFSNVIFSMQNLLMTSDRDTFKTQLDKLEHVISYMMVDSVKEEVTLKDEIRFYNSYVELERLRHSSYIDYQVHTENVDFMIHLAPLLFENLICNAFKFCPHDGTGYVHISFTQPEPDKLLFTCENNISPTILNRNGNGKGLPNLKNRLDLMYPKRHTLDLDNLETIFISKLLIQY